MEVAQEYRGNPQWDSSFAPSPDPWGSTASPTPAKHFPRHNPQPRPTSSVHLPDPMGRIERNDAPGTWHHVMNRAIARRTALENRSDFRYFCSLLAREVRRGEIEIHAYCLMSTHFHLLVRSPMGRLSEAMKRIQNRYVRRFNRTRRRDGPLFRGRFRSKVVGDEDYHLVLLRYIDFNPVSAGLASLPSDYPYGSAAAYGRNRGPTWLCRDWVESYLRNRLGRPRYDPSDYRSVFGLPLSESMTALTEKQLGWRSGALQSFDDVVAGSPMRTQDWMLRKALLADGTQPGVPAADANSLLVEARAAQQREPSWTVRATSKTADGWPIVLSALLKDLCGLTTDQVAGITQASTGTVSRRLAAHRVLLGSDAEYLSRAGDLAHRAIQATGWGNAESG